PVARQRNVKFVIGSSLNAGFISGSPRYNYGKMSWDISRRHIDKRARLRAVAAQFGVDLRTAALRFSAAPDVAAALIVGAHTEEQVLANVTSMQARIPPEFLGRAEEAKANRGKRAHTHLSVVAVSPHSARRWGVRSPTFHAGAAKLPGLFGVARHSDVRSL